MKLPFTTYTFALDDPYVDEWVRWNEKDFHESLECVRWETHWMHWCIVNKKCKYFHSLVDQEDNIVYEWIDNDSSGSRDAHEKGLYKSFPGLQ